MHGSINGWSCTEAGLTIPRSVSTSLLVNHSSQFALCNLTCFLSFWLLSSAFPFVTLPCSLDLTLGTGFLIIAFYCLFWRQFRFPSDFISFIHQLRLQHLQHLPFDLRMPMKGICLNSVSRTQKFNEKKKWMRNLWSIWGNRVYIYWTARFWCTQ